MKKSESVGTAWRALLLALLPLVAMGSTGIDCGKPQHATEEMICGDAQLKMIDGMLWRVYDDLKGRLGGEEAKKLEAEQRQWVNQRNGFMCPDIYACLSTYNQRLIELRRRADAQATLKPEQRRMLRRVEATLAKMEESWEIGVESEITHLPDRGLRGLYLRSGIDAAALEKWFGVAPYLSGPHRPRRFEFQDKKDFGHYDPKFLNLLKGWLDFFIDHALALPLAQALDDNQLLDIVPAYYRMYEYMQAPENTPWVKEMLTRYRKAIEGGGEAFRGGYRYPYLEFLEVAQKLEREEGFNVYELATAGPFWLRRRMDGTERQWAAMAQKLLDTFESVPDPGP